MTDSHFHSFVYPELLRSYEICAGKLETKISEQAGEGEIEKPAHSLNLMAQRLTGRITSLTVAAKWVCRPWLCSWLTERLLLI